jgi:LDH2 family malate/lactate/ureidoglycolate dehydrogenase
MTQIRFSAEDLESFASGLLTRAGLANPQADVTAHILVEGDLMGHDTHGLAMLAPYLKEIEAGKMTRSGEPTVLSDRGASILWDGQRLPGPWLVCSGIDMLMPRAQKFGSATLVIRRSHHIACLAAYLVRATDAGFMMLLASSDAASQSVAPHGGTRAVMTPNPIAAGIPSSTTPFLVDISSSITTNGMCGRMQRADRQFDEEWLLDAHGLPSRDPAVLATNPPGTLLPLGGLTSGYKGFGMALIVEALTAGLAGRGRADASEGWGATVYLTLHDPSAFGGIEDFKRQTDWVARESRNNPPRPGIDSVRMPGDRGLALKARQLVEGIALHSTIPPMLRDCGKRYGLEMPEALTPA